MRRARRWRPGEDPTPIYEALGWALVLKLNGNLGEQPVGVVEELKALGAAAVATAKGDGCDGDDLDLATQRARAIVDALGAAPSSPSPSPHQPGRGDLRGDLIPPSAQRIRRMQAGDLDGLAAGSCALYVSRRGPCT